MSSTHGWSVPQWHPARGDPRAEVAYLRAVADVLEARLDGIRCRLDAFEEGYLRVEVVDTDGQLRAELCVAGGDERRLAILLGPGAEEQEVYAVSAAEAAERIAVYVAGHG